MREKLEKIELKQVDDMLKAIIDCVLPKKLVKILGQEAKVIKDNVIFFLSLPKPVQFKMPNLSPTKPGPKAFSMLTLKLPFNKNKIDSRLMIWLGKTLPYKSEHLFFIQKKANTILLLYNTIEKMIYVKTRIALILANKTML